MNLKELQSNIAELVSVAPQSLSKTSEAAEAAQWIAIEKVAETEAEELLGPPIKTAFDAHKKLTTQRKTLLENLLAAKEKVRAQLATWIASGNPVENCSIRTKYKVTVEDAGLVPSEYLTFTADMLEIQKAVDSAEGKIEIPGCKIETIHTLYTTEAQ